MSVFMSSVRRATGLPHGSEEPSSSLHHTAGAVRGCRSPGLINVTSDLQIKNPQLHVEIDRDKAATHRVIPEQIENALFAAYGPAGSRPSLRRTTNTESS